MAALTGLSLAVVLDELAEIAVLALADRPVEADRVPADVQHAAGFVDADVGRLGRLFDRRLAAQLLQQLLATRCAACDIVSIMWTGMRIVRA